MTRFRPGLIFACVGLTAMAAAASLAQAVALPDAPGRQQVMAACTRCHGVDVIAAQPRSAEQWSEVVSVMIGHGAALNDAEYEQIVAYLSANLGPEKAAGN